MKWVNTGIFGSTFEVYVEVHFNINLCGIDQCM
jgi:hypothetical protein